MMHNVARIVAAAVFLSFGAAVAGAADAETNSADVAHVDAARSDRLLGVLPNYMTVDAARAAIQTTHDAFKAASLSTFDPFVYPFVGATTMFGSGHDGSYAVRYSRALADNSMRHRRDKRAVVTCRSLSRGNTTRVGCRAKA